MEGEADGKTEERGKKAAILAEERRQRKLAEESKKRWRVNAGGRCCIYDLGRRKEYRDPAEKDSCHRRSNIKDILYSLLHKTNFIMLKILVAH